jgi:hypothetical protein
VRCGARGGVTDLLRGGEESIEELRGRLFFILAKKPSAG